MSISICIGADHIFLAMNTEKPYADCMRISVSVKPNAKKNQIEVVDERQYIVRVKSAPTEGKANETLIALLAEYFDVARSRITIRSGRSSRKKIIEIE